MGSNKELIKRLVRFIEHDENRGAYVINMGPTTTPIKFQLTGSRKAYDCFQDRWIKTAHTPLTTRSSHTEFPTQDEALHRALDNLIFPYLLAVKAGEKPKNEWFVPNTSWPDYWFNQKANNTNGSSWKALRR